MRPWLACDRPRVGRLEAEAAGAIDRSEQDLQQVQRAAGLESVGMGRDPAHGVKRHRPADHLVVPLALHVGPGPLDHHFALECRLGDLAGEAGDGVSRDPGPLRHRSGAYC
jgi:hypothetical protein